MRIVFLRPSLVAGPYFVGLREEVLKRAGSFLETAMRQHSGPGEAAAVAHRQLIEA